MAVQTYVGSFDSRIGTGTQSITGVGFQPKALIVWGGVGVTTGSGNWWNAVYTSLGYAGSTGGITQFAVGIYSQDAATQNSSRRMSEAIITRPWTDGQATPNDQATLTSFDADGFTINWTNNADRAHWNFMAIGGSDITGSRVVAWTWPTSAGAKAVTGVGFMPDLVLHATSQMASYPAAGAASRFGFGAMNKHGQQWANAVGSNDAVATTNTSRHQRTDACILVTEEGESNRYQARFQSMDADGFTLYTTINSYAGAYYTASLCLQGLSSKLGAFTRTLSATSQTVPTRHNFTIRSAMFSSFGDPPTAAPTNFAIWSLGASDTSNQVSIALLDRDGVATSEADSIWFNNAAMSVPTTGPSTFANLIWNSSTPSDVTIGWSPAPASWEFETLYLLIGDSGGNTVPQNLPGTSTNAESTAYSNQKKIYRTSNNVIWAVINYLSAASGEFSYSTDNGATWVYYGAASIPGWANGSITGYSDANSNEYLVATWKQTGTGGGRADTYTYVMVGAFNPPRTTVTWGAAVEAGNGYEDATTRPYINYPDVVAHGEGVGTGGQIHVFTSLTNTSVQRVRHYTAPVTGTSIGAWVNTSITGVGTGNLPSPFASASFDPLTKRLFVAWSNGVTGVGNGIRFATAPYSAGTWTWGGAIDVDTSVYLVNTSSWLRCLFDGTRVVIAGYAYTGSQAKVIAHDINPTTLVITPRNLTDPFTGGTDERSLGYGSAATDPNGNLYLFGVSNSTYPYVLRMRKWDRSTGTQTSTILDHPGVSSGLVYASAMGANSSIAWLYTHGNSNPYTVKYDCIKLNNPQSGLTLPSSGTTANFNAGYTFRWSYYAPDSAVQTGWAFKRVRSADSVTEYWNDGSGAWQAQEIYNSGTATQLVFGAGKWPAGQSYRWTVSVQNANGISGYAPAFTVTDSNAVTGVQVEVGSFNKATAVGFQDVTISQDLTNAPTGSWAVILWSSGATPATSGVWASHVYGVMVGFVANGGGTISEYSVSASMQDGLAASNTSRHMIAKAISLVDSNGSASKDAANFVGFTSPTQMRLNWTSQAGGFGTQIINYMIISGLTGAKVVNWSHNAVGNKSVTGVGFKPDLVLHAGQEGGGVGTSTGLAYFGIGAMNQHGQQWANSFASEDGVTPSNTSRYQQTDAAFALVGPGESPTTQFHFVSMDNDGFTVYFSNAPYFQYPLSLCLKGISSKLGAFTKLGSGSPVSQTIESRQGFVPKALVMSSIGSASSGASLSGSFWNLGATDGTNHRAVGLQDLDASNPTNAKALWVNDGFMVESNGGAPPIMSNKAISPVLANDSFGLTWNPSTAFTGEYVYMLIGDSGTSTFPVSASTNHFAPTAIAGLRLWFRADTLGLSDGANVTAWNDESGNATNAAVSGTAPTFRTNVINGRPVVRFTGAGTENLRFSRFALATYTVFWVGKVNNSTSAASSVQHRVLGDSTGGIYFEIGYDQGKQAFSQYSGSWINYRHSNDYSNSFKLNSQIRNSASGAYELWVNGGQPVTGTIATSGSNNIDTIGNGYGYGQNAFAGDVAEIILYTSVLTAGQREQVEAYLMNKYGLGA